VRSVALIAFVVATASACSSDPGRLDAELVGSATADPLIFHGNCFAGWLVSADVELQETRGKDVTLDLLNYRLFDQGREATIGSENLDGPALQERYGTRVVAANGTRVFRVGLPSEVRPEGPLLVTGNAIGLDEDGNGVNLSSQLGADLVVTDPVPAPGACPPE
jgi:hypothetical protein